MVTNHSQTLVEKNKEGIFHSVETKEHAVTDFSQVIYKTCSQTGNRYPIYGTPILYFCLL